MLQSEIDYSSWDWINGLSKRWYLMFLMLVCCMNVWKRKWKFQLFLMILVEWEVFLKILIRRCLKYTLKNYLILRFFFTYKVKVFDFWNFELMIILEETWAKLSDTVPNLAKYMILNYIAISVWCGCGDYYIVCNLKPWWGLKLMGWDWRHNFGEKMVYNMFNDFFFVLWMYVKLFQFLSVFSLCFCFICYSFDALIVMLDW